MALKIPSSLRLSDLKLLASRCGIATSGTKPLLTQRIHDEITSTPKTLPHPARILSIDMGIRNLAYCVLDIPAYVSESAVVASRSLKASRGFAEERPNSTCLPRITAWQKVAVSTAPTELDINGAKVKELFDPATLSKAAYTLLCSNLLLQSPTIILIERQRFRSMGSKHILEWTIRVNVFESILYGVLSTLQAEGAWIGEVIPIIPGRVGPFWLGDEAPAGLSKTRTSKSTKVQNKGLKIDLVRRWLEAGDVVELGNDKVRAMAGQYMEKWGRSPGGIKGRKRGEEDLGTEVGKLDDLSDCLLQGMAWCAWEENKRRVLLGGVESVVEVPDPKVKRVTMTAEERKASRKQRKRR